MTLILIDRDPNYASKDQSTYAKTHHHSSEVSGVVPCSVVRRAGDGGLSIRGNTDTPNPMGVLFVHQQGLAGLDVPHPEW